MIYVTECIEDGWMFAHFFMYVNQQQSGCKSLNAKTKCECCFSQNFLDIDIMTFSDYYLCKASTLYDAKHLICSLASKKWTLTT